MRIVTPEFNLIKIGYQGENEAVCVQIGVQNWPELYGAGGTFSLRHQRAGDPDGYPVIVTEADGIVSWVVSNIDTRDPGYGKATLIYKVNDVIAMSVEYSTLTEASVGENPEPPEPWKPWIDEILEARDEAVEAAEDAHEDANSASQSADDASTEALKAEGYAVGTQDGEAVGPDSPYYQNSAKYYHDDIMGELGPVLTHLTDYNNPHQVTKSQVGLGNADNTSDLDKPISTATQAALDGKISKVAGAVADNIAVLTAGGEVADSGITKDWLVPVKAKSGTVIEFNSDAAVPLKSALIKGKTAVLNQLLTTNSIAAYTGTGVTVTYTDNKITFAETGNGYRHAHYTSELIEGHKYLFRCSNATTTKAGATFTEMWIGPKTSRTDIYGDIALGANDIIFTAIRNTSLNAVKLFFSVYLNSESYDIELTNAQLIDLTAIGFTSDETASVDALKAAWLSKYGTPLPQYIPYSAGSIVSNNATYQLCGHNVWDEEWENGYYNTSTGQKTPDASDIRCKNLIPVKPNTTYHFTRGSAGALLFFDANGEYLNNYMTNAALVAADNNFTTPANCGFIAFYVVAASYGNDICVNISDASFNGQYEPFHDGGSIVADSLNGFDGTAVFDTQNAAGGIERKVGLTELGARTWTVANADAGAFYTERLTDNKSTLNAMAAGYQIVNYADRGTDKSISFYDGGRIYLHDSAYANYTTAQLATALAGKYLAYELITPTTDTTTPATLTTQKGYNILRTVSGDIQNAPADIEYLNGLAAVIAEALQ